MRRYRIDSETTSYYFSTCTIVEWLCVFKEEKYFQIIVESLNYCREKKGLFLLGLVIMLNHIHLITSNRDETNLSDIMRDFKRYTSTKIAAELEEDNEKLFLYVFRKAAERQGKKSKYKIWKDDFHPEALYSQKWFNQKMNYLHANPERKGLVIKPEDWKYSSARNWILDDHSVITLDLDILTV